VLSVGIRIRHGSIFRPIREKLLYRLMLASIAGWLSAWFILPLGFFGVPVKTLGFIMPGTFFGVLVMLSMLEHPEKHPLRGVVLVWAATVAHVAIWVTGFSVYSVTLIDALQDVEWAYFLMILGSSVGVIFGVIVFIAMSRIFNLRFDRRGWFIAIFISAVGGTIYVGALFGWPEWVRNLERFTFSDSPMFFAYILWYVATAAVFDLGKPQPQSSMKVYDLRFLGGLVLITILAVLMLTQVFS
jgi:hypothetical protein